MDWEKIARTVAPTVATGLFGPLGGIVANIVGGVLLPGDAAKGVVTPQDVANKIATLVDPADVEKLRQAELALKKYEADNNFRFAQLEAANMESARTMRSGALASGNKTSDRLAWVTLISFLVVAGLVLVLVSLLLTGEMAITEKNQNAWLAVSGLLGSILGYFSANASQVVSFYFGSSAGSAAKGDQLADQASQALTALVRQPPGASPAAQPAAVAHPAPPAAAPVAPAAAVAAAAPGAGVVVAAHREVEDVAIQQVAPATQPAPAATQPAAAQPPALVIRPGAVADIPDMPDAAGRFARSLELILQFEGGFSDIPADRGGPTNLGITIPDLRRHRGHNVTVDDIRNLTRQEAGEIYREDYWNVVRGNQLPKGIDLCAFDGGVLCGPGTSVRFLQTAMGFTGGDVDGRIGFDTVTAARAGNARAIIEAYVARRREFHHQIVAGNASQAIFLQGWLNRVDKLEQTALGMLDS